jgi:hypothetical protein
VKAKRRLPSWWPSVGRVPAIVVASGPSAAGTEEALYGVATRAKRTFFVTVNSSWKLAPFADVLYAHDAKWWQVNDGAQPFLGLKVAGQRAMKPEWKVHEVKVCAGDQRALMDTPGTLGAGGGNSGFQAVNLVAQFGCSPIVLVGFDMTLDHGVHWHPDHGKGLHNPRPERIKAWRRYMDAAAPVYAKLGIEVLNASPQSALKAYRHVTLEEVFP